MIKSLLSAASLLLSAVNAAEYTCGCYTASTTITNASCAALDPTPVCATPDCIIQSMVTVPASDTRCPKTPTLTFYSACATTCRRGCGIITSTVTADGITCIKQNTTSAAAATPFVPSLTQSPETTTTSLASTITIPSSTLLQSTTTPESTSTPESTTSPESTPTPASTTEPLTTLSSPSSTDTTTDTCTQSSTSGTCYTATEKLKATGCPPLPSGCFTADCIIESTVTAPPVDSGCPVTPTIIRFSSCVTGCVGGCDTTYMTVTASLA